jgi:hypothetical protein
LKPDVAKNGSNRGSSLALAVALLSPLVACGSYSTRGAGDAFVGTWSCPSLPAAAQTIVISENLDNSLTLTGESDAGSDFCATDEWAYSGSTVTMQNGTSCLGGATGQEVVTVNSFKMTVNGSSLIINAAETVVGSTATTDGGAVTTTQNVSLIGTCKKQ